MWHAWGREEVFYRVVIGRPPGKTVGRWEDNIKMDLGETGIDRATWIRLAQDRVQWRVFVSTVMNFRVAERKQAVV
jgi:hypothetical protein